MPPPEPPQGVGKTALGVARVRALESQREDRLFDDPYAQAFVDAAPGAFPEERAVRARPAAHGPLASLGAAFSAHAVIRTRFYDDFLTAATAAGSRQVVLLAAGLDTRAFRLAWPAGTRVFELDLPGVLAFKEAVLGAHGAVPRCERAPLARRPRLAAGVPRARGARPFLPAPGPGRGAQRFSHRRAGGHGRAGSSRPEPG